MVQDPSTNEYIFPNGILPLFIVVAVVESPPFLCVVVRDDIVVNTPQSMLCTIQRAVATLSHIFGRSEIVPQTQFVVVVVEEEDGMNFESSSSLLRVAVAIE